jgi:hypothetical protein
LLWLEHLLEPSGEFMMLSKSLWGCKFIQLCLWYSFVHLMFFIKMRVLIYLFSRC